MTIESTGKVTLMLSREARRKGSTKQRYLEKRKGDLIKCLREISRKLEYYQSLAAKAWELQRACEAEFRKVDRELFQISPGITKVRTRKKKEDILEAPEAPDYSNLSTKAQQRLLKHLLELQKKMLDSL